MARFLRFRLRTLLIACTLFCMLLALYLIPAYQQRQAAAQFTAHGISVYYERDLDTNGRVPTLFYGSPGNCYYPANKYPDPLRWYQVWLHCDFAERVVLVERLDQGTMTDDDLAQVEHFPHLRELDASWSEVTDVGVRNVARLKHLRLLNLRGTTVTGESFDQLRSLPKLEELDLRRTAISPAGFVKLSNLTTLQSLDLNETPLNGCDLPLLANLKSLRYLDLWETGVTPETIAELQRALPECRIDWEGAPPEPSGFGGIF